ncbi:MAG: glycosyltransferase family 2 protein [Anaerolineales bacterium]
MPPLTEISAVIINHNSGGTVLNVIRSLLEQDPPPKSILVVDDRSQDGSPSEIRASFPGVRLIELERNMGLSYARNVGLNLADSEFVLLLDDDVYLANGALQKLNQAQKETGAAVVVPRLVFHPGDSVIQCDGAQIHMTGTLRARHTDQPIESCPAEQTQISAFIGACLLIHKQTLISLEGFDPDYFFYFEDLELSYRLRGLGHMFVCAAQALAYHDRGQGTPGLSYRGSGKYPVRRAYYIIRHRWLTIWLHYQLKTLIVLSPMLALYELALFAVALSRGWIGEWFKAFLWVIKNAPVIRARRTRWQSLRKVPDREILSAGPLPFAPGVVQARATLLAIRMLEHVSNRYWMIARRWL